MTASRDRDATGRPRNARPRDALGRPLPRAGSGALQAPVDEPALPPQAALERAQQLLDSGQPFAAHEVLEAVWKSIEGPERALWRALAQLCVGVTHAQRGNPVGARALLERAADNLTRASPAYGVDPAGLAEWARRAAEQPDPLPPMPTLRV